MKTLAMLAILVGGSALAAWPTDAGEDVPVANVPRGEYPSLVVDAKNGVYVVWSAVGTANAKSLRGERFTLDGTRLWGMPAADGGFFGRDLLGLSIGAGLSGKAQAVRDNDGGFIAVYTAGNNGPFTIHGQQFDSTGAPQWAATGTLGGVQVLATPSAAMGFLVVSDDQGGALLNVVASSGMFAHKLSSTGALVWGAGGVNLGAGQLPTVPYSSQYLRSDGAGGLYFLYPTSGSSSQSPTLKHVSAAGVNDLTVATVAPASSSFGLWSLVAV